MKPSDILSRCRSSSPLQSQACAGGGVTETPPVFLTNPQGSRVEALAMTTARATPPRIRLARRTRADLRRHPATGHRLAACSPAPSCTTRPRRTFTLTGSMTVPRAGETITMLRDGRVLLTGGVQNAGFRSSALECGDLRSGRGHFQRDRSDVSGREGHTATMLSRRKAFLSPAAATNGTTRWTRPRFQSFKRYVQRAGHLASAARRARRRRCSARKVLIAGGGRGGMPAAISRTTRQMYTDPIHAQLQRGAAHMKTIRVGACGDQTSMTGEC